MTAAEKRPQAPDPHEQPLAEVGKASIIVPLIIGGAIIVAVILLWEAHNSKLRIIEMSRIEEMTRIKLRGAYVKMRALRPEIALQKSKKADELLTSLNAKWHTDYADLKISLNLLEGESLLMQDCAANAPEAEKRFDQAIAFMNFASGEMWQFGMLGRARARIKQGKFQQALADLNSVMDRNPSFGSAYYWRSLTRKNLGDDAGAKADENRTRSLDSWPPLRDFMQASCVWTRDILTRPETGLDTPAGDADRTLVPFFIPKEDADL